jgi:hypothetical protein
MSPLLAKKSKPANAKPDAKSGAKNSAKTAKNAKAHKPASYVSPVAMAARQSWKSRLRVLRSRRALIVVTAVLMVALLVFAEIIRPDQDARAYTARLQASSRPLQACFEKLADTTQSDIFYAPDIAIKDRQADAATISKQVAICQKELAHFNAVAGELLNLHFSGYTQTYHQAKVNQRQAYDVIGQSSDVLDQYGDLAAMLTSYYAHIKVFLDDFSDMQAVADYDANVVVLPFTQLKASYVPKQVQQLPVKVRNLLAAQKE